MVKKIESPNAEQLARLQEYANKNGRNWKTKLSTDWITGKDASQQNGHLLRQVRNNCLPWFNSKLNTIKPE